MINTFLNDYLARDQGLGTPAATLVLTCMGVGGLAGSALGGLGGHAAFKRGKSCLPLFAGAMAIVGAAPFLALLNLPRGATPQTAQAAQNPSDPPPSALSWQAFGSGSGSGVLGGGAPPALFGWYLFFALLSGLCITQTGSNVRALVQNCTLPRARGVAFSVFNLSDDVGKGLGPAAVAALITAQGDR